MLIRKYADLTLPTPAYGGKVHTLRQIALDTARRVCYVVAARA